MYAIGRKNMVFLPTAIKEGTKMYTHQGNCQKKKSTQIFWKKTSTTNRISEPQQPRLTSKILYTILLSRTLPNYNQARINLHLINRIRPVKEERMQARRQTDRCHGGDHKNELQHLTSVIPGFSFYQYVFSLSQCKCLYQL